MSSQWRYSINFEIRPTVKRDLFWMFCSNADYSSFRQKSLKQKQFFGSIFWKLILIVFGWNIWALAIELTLYLLLSDCFYERRLDKKIKHFFYSSGAFFSVKSFTGFNARHFYICPLNYRVMGHVVFMVNIRKINKCRPLLVQGLRRDIEINFHVSWRAPVWFPVREIFFT